MMNFVTSETAFLKPLILHGLGITRLDTHGNKEDGLNCWLRQFDSCLPSPDWSKSCAGRNRDLVL